MIHRLVGVAVCASLCASIHAPIQAVQVGPVRDLTDTYVRQTFARKYDALLELYATDALFSDPTGAVFGGAMAQGPVRGADSIVALQKSWGLAEADFQVDAAFTVGQFSLYRGQLRTRYASGPSTSFEFVTVLRVEDERITERVDFGEYVGPFGLTESFGETGESTRGIAREYLTAYLEADFEGQRRLLAPNARFQDPTARVYGPGGGQLLEGAGQILQRRKQTFGNIEAFDLEIDNSFVSANHAVYMGTTTYRLGNGTRYAQPAVFVVEVRDGQVSRHWDFVDYSVGPVSSF